VCERERECVCVCVCVSLCFCVCRCGATGATVTKQCAGCGKDRLRSEFGKRQQRCHTCQSHWVRPGMHSDCECFLIQSFHAQTLYVLIQVCVSWRSHQHFTHTRVCSRVCVTFIRVCLCGWCHQPGSPSSGSDLSRSATPVDSHHVSFAPSPLQAGMWQIFHDLCLLLFSMEPACLCVGEWIGPVSAVMSILVFCFVFD
jgi:hypothetical protein